MNQDEFQRRLGELAVLKLPRPDSRYKDNDDYYDPGIKVAAVPIIPRACEYCPRQDASGRTVAKMTLTDRRRDWRVYCLTCYRYVDNLKSQNGL